MADRRILNSWKEIANYLGRGVRTVQRWETQLGLPVHRPAGKDHSAVLAVSSELDQWLDRRPMRSSSSLDSLSEANTVLLETLLAKTDVLLQKCDTLLSRNDELTLRVSELTTVLSHYREQENLPKPATRRAEAGVA